MANNISVGKICGSPLCGLCERVCIRVKKVTDGCIVRLSGVTFENVGLTLVGAIAPVPPLVFVLAENTAQPIITQLSVTTIDDNRVRVSYEANFPIKVTFTDALMRTFTANGNVSVMRDVVLRVPADGREYSIEVTGRLLSRLGSITPDLFADFTCCIALITAIVVSADLIVPTYGECVYPDCNEFEDDACRAIFDTPPFGNSVV